MHGENRIWKQRGKSFLSNTNSAHLQWTLKKSICFCVQNTNPLKKSCLLSFPDCTNWCNNWPMWSLVIWLLSSVDSTPTRTKTGSRFWALSSSTHCIASCSNDMQDHLPELQTSTKQNKKWRRRMFTTSLAVHPNGMGIFLMAGQETPGFDFSFENGYLLKTKVLN